MQQSFNPANHGEPEGSRDPEAIALEALGWICSDGVRARRFLDLTGLSPDSLRESAGHPVTLCAAIDFLCAHEPDLTAAAQSIGLTPEDLAATRGKLAR